MTTTAEKPLWLRWVEALESGKYSQAQGVLYDADTGGMCCLGVLCDVYDPSGWGEPVPFLDPNDEDGESEELQRMVHPYGQDEHKAIIGDADKMEFIAGGDGVVMAEDLERYYPRSEWPEQVRENLRYVSLVAINDTGGSFAEIAKLIRAAPHLFFNDAPVPEPLPTEDY